VTPRYTEDLPRLAAEAVKIARCHCGSCINFHLLWPYLRLAKGSGGDVNNAVFRAALERWLSKPGRKVLIAGAADTGVLAVVARAANVTSEITIIDRCNTPLALCRDFAERWSLPIEAVRLDLRQRDLGEAFDIVVVHSLLQFVPADNRVDVLSRLRHSLRPDGRLLIVFRTSVQIEGDLLREYRETYSNDVIRELMAKKISLPEDHDAFRHRLDEYSEERRAREGAHQSHGEVEQMIVDAGFAIEEFTPIDADLAVTFQKFNAKIDKRRFMIVAKPRI
jgi:SAM-dependent methyltransferase